MKATSVSVRLRIFLFAFKIPNNDERDDDCESDDCRSDDDDDEESKEELMDMLESAHTCLEMKRKECKKLQKELKALKQSFDEL